MSLDSQLNHRLSQYTYKRSKKLVAASQQGHSRYNLSSEESQNVLTLVLLTNNRCSGIDP